MAKRPSQSPTSPIFGRNLQEVREREANPARKLTQAEVTERLEAFGLPKKQQSQISGWEKGAFPSKLELVLALAVIYRVPVERFFRGILPAYDAFIAGREQKDDSARQEVSESASLLLQKRAELRKTPETLSPSGDMDDDSSLRAALDDAKRLAAVLEGILSHSAKDIIDAVDRLTAFVITDARVHSRPASKKSDLPRAHRR